MNKTFFIRKKTRINSNIPRPIHRVRGIEDALLLPIRVDKNAGKFFFNTEEGDTDSAPLGTCVTTVNKNKRLFIKIIPEETITKCFRESKDGKFYDLPPVLAAELLNNKYPEFAKHEQSSNILFSQGHWIITPFGGTTQTILPNTGIVYLVGTSPTGTILVDFIPFTKANDYWACNSDGSTICSLDNFFALKK